ncbi:ABC transporter permease [Candidatus Finniella inopinata]|uniref:ABC transporter permease n=1 Tax=Candidatus Finniella inopinata TaxID=1696036 RepID=A0A4Q7DIX3_9PROT|nr:ABC transporter permease [Candidatus Finniella inopinata]RZI46931.1 ABC transporter permease [Candidatus Finniella inopinata]
MLKRFITAFILLSLWHAIVNLANIPAYILPTPWQVASALFNQRSLICWHGGLTLAQILAGLLISSILGMGMAFILDRNPRLQAHLHPVLVILQATPAFILMPLLMIWFGFGLLPKMIVVCLSAFFPITLCFLDGLKRTPVEWLELAHTMKALPFPLQYRIRWPAALPGLLSGLRLAAIHAPLTVLAADWNGASHGLGYLMMLCHGRLQTDLLFACLFCTVLLTLFLNGGIRWLQSRFIFWPASS